MIHKELSVEQVTFACSRCAHTWTVDYAVEHVDDGHGHTHDYYLRYGLPVVNPRGNHAVACGRCGCDHITIRSTPHHPAGR